MIVRKIYSVWTMVGMVKFSKIVSLIWGIVLFCSPTAFSQTIINTWEGTSSEEVNYQYTLNVDFTGMTAAYVFVPLIPSFNTPTHSQSILNQSFTYSIEPSSTTQFTDMDGNEYIKAEWVTPIDSVKVIRETDVSISTVYGPFVTSTPYPIDLDSIPDDIQIYLQSTSLCQSDTPEIVNLADSLVKDSFSEADAVVKIINWVRYHMQWICTCDMPFIYSDALNTLLYGGGNCVNFGNLSMALLRAAGIPAREVFGPMVHEWAASCGHRWVEVYYPDKGWVQYESSYWMPNEGSLPWTFSTPRHIKVFSGPGQGLSSGNALEEHHTVTTITSSPTSIETVSSSIDTNEFVTHILTVRNEHFNEPDTFLITVSATSDNWRGFLSQHSIYINPQEEWGSTRDITVTIAPPENTYEGDSVTVTVTATSQRTGLNEQVFFQISVSSLTGVREQDVTTVSQVPEQFWLSQNYPNPFVSTTTIKFALPKESQVSLKIYDMSGRLVRALIDKEIDAGYHEVVWDSRDDNGKLLPKGVYFCRFVVQPAGEVKEFRATKKLISFQ